MAAGAHVAEDKGLWLEDGHGAVEERPIILLLAPVGAFAVGTVEPLFEDRAVMAKGVEQRLTEGLVVGGGAVGGSVAVPRGDVDTHFYAPFAASVGEAAQHVALALQPLALGHGVRAGGVGPEAEAVVMFGGEDDATHACSLGCGDPLVAVEGGGIEDVFGFGTLAPLFAGEGVGAEMAEHVHLHALPPHLLGCGARAIGRRGRRTATGNHGGASVQQ